MLLLFQRKYVINMTKFPIILGTFSYHIAVPCTPLEMCDSTNNMPSPSIVYTVGNTIIYTCNTNYVFSPTTTPTVNELTLTCAVNGLLTSWTGYNSHSCTCKDLIWKRADHYEACQIVNVIVQWLSVKQQSILRTVLILSTFEQHEKS